MQKRNRDQVFQDGGFGKQAFGGKEEWNTEHIYEADIKSGAFDL
jgi:hypothetical protein